MRFMILVLCVIGYLTAWVTHPAGGLTFHAFDLAEWASLHPLVRAESPALLTTLLLRLPLVAISILFALSAHRVRRWRIWCWAAACATVLGLLPPLDFVTQISNGNYQQQFGLALIAAAALALSLTGRLKHAYPILSAAVTLIGLISGLVGFTRALDLLRAFDVAVSPGVGIFVTNIGLILFALTLMPRQTVISEGAGQPKAAT